MRILFFFAFVTAALAQPVTLYTIPNTHGTVSGWLVDFDTERNYVLNNYLAHLDRVKKDDHYTFAYSEVPNVISFLDYAKERLPELKQLHKLKRFEFSNGFFVEPDINLSGGEALVQMGVHGLRWYEEVFGFRPRHCWMIDLTGAHRQFPQIVTGLGMDSVFINRNNPTNQAAFWWVAPDGTRALALFNRSYAEFGIRQSGLFSSKEPLADDDYAKIAKIIENKRPLSPSKTIMFSLAGAEDYSLPPARESQPSEFLKEWSRRHPNVKIRFSIPSDYVDALNQELKAGTTKLRDYAGDTGYSWDSFWLNMPEVKQYYRKDEHLLQGAEALATAASLRGKLKYPAQDFYHSWINMLMNMDRNTIWGASAGMVFKDPRHWDAWDRFQSVEQQAQSAGENSARALAGAGSAVTLYNTLNWKRNDPVELNLGGQVLDGVPCEAVPGGGGLAVCRPSLPSAGVASFALKSGSTPGPQPAALPREIETAYYSARIDSRSGALVSLKVKPSGQELLAGPANVIAAETIGKDKGAEHFVPPRPKRRMLGTSSAHSAKVTVLRGPLSTRIRVVSQFHGGSSLDRRIVFYRDHPRIDFETHLDLKADDVLVGADFPLAGAVVERSRGIPYGFSSVDPKRPAGAAVPDPRQPGSEGAILPCIRWANYQLSSGAGLALLDRGLTGQELNGSTVTLGLVNAVSAYMKKPNEMLRGQGRRTFSYALVPHSGSWQQAGIARMAWEFNAPPMLAGGTGTLKWESFLESSGNVIVEAVRRVGRQIEIRLVESHGQAGAAEITVRLPHRGAALTNLMGEKPQRLGAGPTYRFPVRPQQIVTLRLNAGSAVPAISAIRNWSALVPVAKRKALAERILEKGHPGR